MMKDGPCYFLVCNKADLLTAARRQTEGFGLVAGSLHILNRLEADGLPALSPENLTDDHIRRNIPVRVAHIVNCLSNHLSSSPWSDGFRAVALANVTRTLLNHFGIAAIQSALDGPLYCELEGKLVKAITARVAAKKLRAFRVVSIGDAVPTGKTRSAGNHILDFRSPSGLKLSQSNSERYFIVKTTNASPLTVRFKNTWSQLHGILGGVRKLRLRMPNPTDCASSELCETARSCADSTVVGNLMASVLNETWTGFWSHREGMRTFLSRTALPHKAVFNHVEGEIMAGFFEALTEAGVPCEVSSHGCLIEYGNESRRIVTHYLAEGVYNSFPGVSELVPRSPLQVPHYTDGLIVRRISRLAASVQNPSERFRVYAAPNFLAWHRSFHGLTMDCFRTRRILEVLTEAVSQIDDFEMDVRIKTTVADMASAASVPDVRGVLPSDVEDLIDPAHGIYNASVGSHAKYLARADLVVTEGVTAVVFEALEARKPLLLLTDGVVAPSLPHMPANALLKGNGARAAVYGATIYDDLPAILKMIRGAHHDAPLTDAELSDYVWL